MLPWSVMPSAGWPSAAAAATSSSTRAAPSSIEYSVWTCRWVNDPDPGKRPLLQLSTAPQPSTGWWRNDSRVVQRS